MPLPASLIASIVSAIIETAVQGYSRNPAQYEIYATTRTLPPEAKLGVMQPPLGDGVVNINGQSMPLAPAVQFRSQRNLIVMSMSIQKPSDVVYLTDEAGAIHRIWILSAAEASAHPRN